jgi:hypothetical protein
MTEASYENYAIYAALVGKLERRLYDLEKPENTSGYCDYIEGEWHLLGHSTDHPSVLEICQRARQMSHLLAKGAA